jgi:hypothetical protein
MSYLANFTVWGNSGTVAYSGMLSTANAVRGGARLKDEIRLSDARDGSGVIFASNAPYSVTSLAAAKGLVALPAPGALVTIAGIGISKFDGDWNYVGGGEIALGGSDEEPIVISGVMLRRVSANGTTVAAQSVVG